MKPKGQRLEGAALNGGGSGQSLHCCRSCSDPFQYYFVLILYILVHLTRNINTYCQKRQKVFSSSGVFLMIFFRPIYPPKLFLLLLYVHLSNLQQRVCC